EGLLEKNAYDIAKILETEIKYERKFKCNACDNYCPISVLNVNEHKYMFGGRCDKYANMRKKRVIDESQVNDYVQRRDDLLFKECAPEPGSLKIRKDIVVGIPRAFSVHTLYPLYSWFFHGLGVKTLLSANVAHEGTVRVESAYCFPAEIAHGAVQDSYDHDVDFLFVPHFKTMPSYEKDVHATVCPITQGLPYYIKKAFPEIPEEKYLSPVIHFKYGSAPVRDAFVQMAQQLGFSKAAGRDAFRTALAKQDDYFARSSALGQEALAEARKAKRPVIAIFGRPYNAFTPEANMGIPRKFTSRGYTVIPFDILPYEDKEIFPNMYWYYGQQDMKATRLIKEEDNIFLTWVTNFSCAPDSFMLHYLKWMMGIKPYLILELDSHSADAGVDTRVEAFLDIIDGYRSKITGRGDERYSNGLQVINNGKDPLQVVNQNTGEKISIQNNPRVKLLLSNMGRISTELTAAALRSHQVNA
ncbi:MAG: activase, partial [bacterium]|nr:activase [bacterium]